MRTIVKRNGTEVEFNPEKITTAVTNAFKSSNEIPAWQIPYKARIITEVVLGELMEKYDSIDEYKTTVEDVQDIVENVLMRSNMVKTAKAYVIYREQHRKNRETNTLLDYKKIVDDYLKVNDWRVKENSTVTYSLGGLILSNSGAISANYWLSEVYDKEIADAHRDARMHIHDLSMISGYCAGWNLKQLIKDGLGGVIGKISSKPASHLSTLCNQMVNFLGIMQNEWAGSGVCQG